MTKLLQFLKGKKTYLAAACLFVVSGLEGIGVLDKQAADVLKGLFAASALAALRAAR